jgi:hypothetical protein
MEYVAMFYDQMVYFTTCWYGMAIWYIFCGILVYFVNIFGTFFPLRYVEKSGNPALHFDSVSEAFAVFSNECRERGTFQVCELFFSCWGGRVCRLCYTPG